MYHLQQKRLFFYKEMTVMITLSYLNKKTWILQK